MLYEFTPAGKIPAGVNLFSGNTPFPDGKPRFRP